MLYMKYTYFFVFVPALMDLYPNLYSEKLKNYGIDTNAMLNIRTQHVCTLLHGYYADTNTMF